MPPTTVLVSILGFLRRRDLDVLERVDRAFGAVVATHEKHLSRRSLSLMFFNEDGVSLISVRDAMKHVPAVEMPQYLPRSVITKMLFKSRKWTEEMYQALIPCRAHLDADAAYDFQSLLYVPNILRRALTELFMCNTLAALPCVANCSTLRIAYYEEVFFDANGALEWLLGTHAVAAGVKHLSIRDIDAKYLGAFLNAFITAIVQQFIQATTPASFTVELRFSNTVTNEQLEVAVHVPDSFTKKVAIHRKSAA
ncbi:hypothetical protein AAVH_19686 [Aphelenchoides avenae]|nr:hypothetical protein AAVH_19686 [Aphelenchus avenae]